MPLAHDPATDPVPDLPPLPTGTFCPECGYDLRGSTSPRCPECGFQLQPLRTVESQIPWAYRRELGWFRAYWRTTWRVIRRPKRFCLEMSRPVSFADSQSFRWITLLHAYVPALLGALAWVASRYARGRPLSEGDWWALGGLLLWVLLMLAALPGLASYFFQWRKLSIEQQNRAIALSYYAWAALPAVPIGLLVLLLGFELYRPPWGSTTTDALFTAAAILPLFGLFDVYVKLNTFAAQIAHETALRRFLRMGLLWMLSVLLGLLLAVVLLVPFYLLVIFHSLR